jgi:hypothetical protein
MLPEQTFFASIASPLHLVSKAGLAVARAKVHIAYMPDADEKPVMEPFPDKTGTGWHVVIRYHEGHERRIEGFSTKGEAVDWITANATQVDE